MRRLALSTATERFVAKNVSAYLPEMARLQPDTLAVAVADHRAADGYQRLSTAELNRLCDQAAHALQSVGVGPGTRTVLMVRPSPAFFALTFAVQKLGAVLVMVDPGMGVKNLGKCLDEAEPEVFIGIPVAQVARMLKGWGKRTLKTIVTVGPRVGWGGFRFEKLVRQASDEPFPISSGGSDEAAILFTSGSTGVPKGVQYNHNQFLAQVEMLRSVYEIQPGEVELSTFPLFALYGPAFGMASIVPDMDTSRPITADPQKLVTAIHQFKCTASFLSPALLKKLGQYCTDHDVQLPSMRRVISAGAPASPAVVRQFLKLMSPEADVFTPYGATESLPVTSIRGTTILNETAQLTDDGAGVCVGHPVEGVEVRIIRIIDEPIPTWSEDLTVPTGTIGEIVVKGPNVTHAYYNREKSTSLAKIRDEDGSVRHRMGDCGYLDEGGRVWMCGRKDHRVETANGPMFSVPCEAIFNTHPQVQRTALVGVSHGEGRKPVLCVELLAEHTRAAESVRKQIVAELRQRAQSKSHTQSIETFLFHPGFPVDVRHNAKIRREDLAVWAAKQLS